MGTRFSSSEKRKGAERDVHVPLRLLAMRVGAVGAEKLRLDTQSRGSLRRDGSRHLAANSNQTTELLQMAEAGRLKANG